MILNKFSSKDFAIHLMGLSDKLQFASINILRNDTDQQTTFHDGDHEILMTDLDGFMDRFYPNQSIGFIKTDLEGAGVDALKGMEHII